MELFFHADSDGVGPECISNKISENASSGLRSSFNSPWITLKRSENISMPGSYHHRFWFIWSGCDLGVENAMYLFELQFCLNIRPGVGLLGLMVTLFSVFWGNSILFSTVAVPADVPLGFAFFGRIAKPGGSECRWAFLELSSLGRAQSPSHMHPTVSTTLRVCICTTAQPLHWHCLPGPPRPLSSHC